MASDYSLNLRATLDTTQVQRELKRLRAAQAQAAQEMELGGVKGTPMGSAHMQKIEVQLTKLNTNISGLQHAIERLSKAQLQVAQQSNIPQHASGMPYIPAGMTPQRFSNWLGSQEYASLNNRVKDLVTRQGFVSNGNVHLSGKTYSFDDQLLAHRVLSSSELRDYGNDFTKTHYEDQRRSWNQAQDYLEGNTKQLASIRHARQFASLIGGQLFGGASDIAKALGYDRASSVLGATAGGFTAGGGVAMAASMLGAGSSAGPLGILAGVATALTTLYSSASEAAVAVQKMSDEMNGAFNTLHQNTLNVQRTVQETRHQTNADMLDRTGNIEEARKLAEWWKENASSMQKQLADADPLAEERRIRERGEARKQDVEKAIRENNWSGLDNSIASFINHLGGNLNLDEVIQKAKNEVDKHTADQIKEMQNRYDSLQRDMSSAEKIESIYQGVVDKIEGEQKKDLTKDAAEVAARLRMSEANDSVIFGYKTRAQLNQTQDFVNSIMGDKSLGPLSKFNAIVEELDTARNQKNTALTNAFEISKFLKQNEGKIDSSEIQAQQKKQSQFEREASTIEQRIGILESALSEIQSNTITPDLSHVTSLAQYGFNMGEKDDSVDRMDKYYSKSINLQQQIRDKIEEGIKTEAIYN